MTATHEAEPVKAHGMMRTITHDALARSLDGRLQSMESQIVAYTRQGMSKEAREVAVKLEALEEFAAEFSGPGWRQYVKENPQS